MGIILYIIFGALVGWIASMIAGTNREQGAIGNIIVGILGAFLGGLVANAAGSGGITGFNLSSFLIALAGAVVLLFIYKAIRGGRTHNSPTLHR
jgi:uncharacterized membrane protein YeaQ/YmgE (transglycosylase-associated protein family)